MKHRADIDGYEERTADTIERSQERYQPDIDDEDVEDMLRDDEICASETIAKPTEVDRAETLINRAVNCGWITVHDREQLKANIRVCLDQEVRSGGPYFETTGDAT